MVNHKNIIYERFTTTPVKHVDPTADVSQYIGPDRMSAPELPPINPTRKNALINEYRRSHTFNYVKSTTETRDKRHSIYSDSALQGLAGNSKSRTSSSSSYSTRNRVLSAGAYRQKLTTDLPKDFLSGFPAKIENSTMRSKAIPEATPRVASTPRKTSVKEMITSQRKIHPSTSDAALPSRVGSTNGYVSTMPRNSSDKSLSDKRNSKNVPNNNNNNISSVHNNHKTGRRSQMNTTINGLRKYSSTLGLDTKADKRSEEETADDEELLDSDSDTEKSQRVIQWIIGVNREAEPPEEPLIDHVDEPPQRDTAIRIVYDGDS
ncbi:dual specificity protein kinase shkD-like [Dreissena polymorpha]|uniref:Uncharacterized protein n=1 Tax=Dreissena polymorpha TaxID=45954 RepID=A0A9D4NLQ9_DREPO|nr:dual specificity protein kinase shkD-like [Dreissena polymorpha]KAH3897066.1 hypothetical protein DPMN_021250 [Dreissena polymorpha]